MMRDPHRRGERPVFQEVQCSLPFRTSLLRDLNSIPLASLTRSYSLRPLQGRPKMAKLQSRGSRPGLSWHALSGLNRGLWPCVGLRKCTNSGVQREALNPAQAEAGSEHSSCPSCYPVE
jgi:hypothetical protein